MPPTIDPLYTYQDLVARFQVHYSTIWRWFHGRRRFKPSNGTVRISETEVQQFISDYTKSNEKKRRHS